MLKSALLVSFFVCSHAFAEDSVSTYLEGNRCVVTNDSATKTYQLNQVRFTYMCNDGISRRAAVRMDGRRLNPQEEVTVPFPGGEGGCMGTYVHGCSAIGQWQP